MTFPKILRIGRIEIMAHDWAEVDEIVRRYDPRPPARARRRRPEAPASAELRLVRTTGET